MPLPFAYYNHRSYMWLPTGKPGIWDLRAISAMRVFSTWGQYLSIFSFCYVRIQKPFFYLLPSLTKAKRKLLRQNKPFLTSVSVYLVSAAARARSPLLWALIRIRSSWLFRWGYIRLSTEQRRTFCASYPARKKLRWQRSTFVRSSRSLRATPPLLKLRHNNWTRVYV